MTFSDMELTEASEISWSMFNGWKKNGRKKYIFHLVLHDKSADFNEWYFRNLENVFEIMETFSENSIVTIERIERPKSWM